MQLSEMASTTTRETGVHLGSSPSGFDIFGDLSRDLADLSTAPLDPSAVDPHRHPEVFRVRVARSRTVQEEAGMLVQRRYEARGYQVLPTVADPSLYTFAAYDSGTLVGTLGVRLDSPTGLKIEQLYGDEVAELRACDLRLIELTRLAVAETAASKEVLGALFHTALLFSHVVRSATHALIEVNPRHVAFYRRILGFKPLGPQRHLDRVGAPAVPLALEFATLTSALKDFFACPDWREHANSFFVHWFSPHHAEGILGRLRRLEDHRQGSTARVPRRNPGTHFSNLNLRRTLTDAPASVACVN